MGDAMDWQDRAAKLANERYGSLNDRPSPLRFSYTADEVASMLRGAYRAGFREAVKEFGERTLKQFDETWPEAQATLSLGEAKAE